MGFSISAATALIFAALFLAFGIFYPAMANGYERVEEADAAKADQDLAQAETDVSFVSYSTDPLPGMGNTDIDALTITVNNTGETALTVDDVNLILQPDDGYVPWNNNDGTDEVEASVEGDEITNLWLPGEQIEIQYDPGGNNNGFTEPNRFKVIAEHGVSISGDT